ncbi:spore germination protein [Streptomyces sp. ISL-14]|nr:spore germination protein [Streptomyces sp. ISL-14]
MRLLRFLAVILALFTPSLYITFISFHPGLIPTKLAISIIGTKVLNSVSSTYRGIIYGNIHRDFEGSWATVA